VVLEDPEVSEDPEELEELEELEEDDVPAFFSRDCRVIFPASPSAVSPLAF
jgi:hypothetical protein